MKPSSVLLLFAMMSIKYTADAALMPPKLGISNVLGPYRRSAVYLNASLEVALQTPDTAAVVLVISGSGLKPQRRIYDQPIISLAPAAAEVIPESVQQSLLATLQHIEALKGVRLYPVVLDVLPESAGLQHDSAATTQQGQRPWAVFDVSSGQLLLRRELVLLLGSAPAEGTAVLVNACMAALGRLMQLFKQAAMFPNLDSVLGAISTSMAAGVAAAFAAAAAGPPKWFCFVCPIVLGLLAPLVINAGVGEAANLACKEMQLTDDECVDLWFGALALGMILSLSSAVPIYKVCRLYECAHTGSTSPIMKN